MINVIVAGKIPDPKFKASCTYCKCVFTFNQSDVKQDHGEREWVECPTCDRSLVTWQPVEGEQ